MAHSGSSQGERVYTGVAVSSGVAHGRLIVLGKAHVVIPEDPIEPSAAAEEVERLQKALAQTRRELLDIQSRVTRVMGSAEAGIFEAHLLVLEDPTLLSEIHRSIQEHFNNAAQAVMTVAQNYAEALAALDDEYLRERSHDIMDVATRIVGNLNGHRRSSLVPAGMEPGILVAHNLTPSDTALLDREQVLGFVTDTGGRTSHTAIMARKLGIPAVVGLGDITRSVHTGDYALIDGYAGTVTINPTDQTLYAYGQLRERRALLEDRLRQLRELPAITLDGHRLQLAANIEHPSDIEAVLRLGAEGVGLFRSEFLFLNRQELPGEEEQFQVYHRLATGLAPAPVVFRTLDLGADKMPGGLEILDEPNPFLGWRAIRICLDQPDLFRTQLRAMLRAAVTGNVRIMFPMISSVDELRAAKKHLAECHRELVSEGTPCALPTELGIMIEVPAAAVIADLLAAEVQFISLGTNDLTGYTLAVDRLNERVANLFHPGHPAVLRLIHTTVDAAHRHGCWVGVCGEMAGEPSLVPLLVGLGVDELSVTPRMVPSIKFLLRRLRRSEAQRLVAQALASTSAIDIQALSLAMARETAPELFHDLYGR